MGKPLPSSMTMRAWEKKDAKIDKKSGVKEGSKADDKSDAQAMNASANVGIAKKPHRNAASKTNNQKATAPVQNFFASKDVMKKKGKGY